MPVHVKRSTDAGATAMVGNANDRLITILDACLQDGYNTLTSVSATRSGTTATYTKSGHGFTSQVGQIVQVSGFASTEYNVTGPIFNVQPTTWDMTISGTPGSDTGGTAKHAPCWGAGTKAFDGTNTAAYRPASGTRFYLGVDDSAATPTNARIRAFESMTAAGVAVGSGTNPYPNDTQMSGGLYFYKSSTNDATARAWILVADETRIYFFCTHSGVTTTGSGFFFGDFWSRKGSDTYNNFIVGDIAASGSGSALRISNISTSWSVNSGHFIARSYTDIAGGVGALKFTDLMRCTGSEIGNSGGAYPNQIEGGIVLCPIWLGETPSATARGTLPGLWSPAHSRPLNHGDTFTGAVGTALAGKSFEAFNCGNAAQIIIETSSTWTAPI